MKRGETLKIFPANLSAEERAMLGELAAEDDRKLGAEVRYLIRKEYKKRKEAEARIFKPTEEAA